MLRNIPRLTRRVALTALVALAASPALAQGSGPLVVYNAQHDTLTQAWVDAFSKETGVFVQGPLAGGAMLYPPYGAVFDRLLALFRRLG